VSRKLIVSDGRRQRELLIISKIVVGRDPTCDLSEADPLLSRRHAEFSIAGEETVVRDLGSRNGIYVNGARTAEGTLQSGDVVRIGRLQMRYVEDSAPLVAAPELLDDATGLVIPGPRQGTPTPPAEPPGPAGASGAIPKPAGSSAFPKPALGSKPKPAPAPSEEDDAEVTSYVSPSSVRKQPASASLVRNSSPPAATWSAPAPQPPPGDEVEQTRVVPAPGRSGLRPPMAPAAKSGVEPSGKPVGRSVVPPPVPLKDDEVTSYVTPRPRTSVQGPPPADHTWVLPPPAPPVNRTAGPPPPLPPPEDMDEPTSVILMPRGGTGAAAAVDAALNEGARKARALAMAVEAIAAFLGSSSKGQPAADAVKVLERDLAAAAPPAELVDALKGLAARVSAAANELT
jgi:hypothetical protein